MSSGGQFGKLPKHQVTSESHSPAHARCCITRRRHIVLGTIMVSIVLGVTLGLGLGVGLSRKRASASSDPMTSNSTLSSVVGEEGNGTWWSPTVGATWQIELQHAVRNTSLDVSVYDIDLFLNSNATIASLHAQNRSVICYFSAGSYENFRPDSKEFLPSDYGNPLMGWPGEWWLNTNSTNVRKIMLARLNRAASMNCDGVDPDNIDAYNNDNGFNLTQSDAVDYVNFLSNAAHARNLSIGLKNGGDIVHRLINQVQWEVNEQCIVYRECAIFQPFIAAGKPVFHIEYLNTTLNTTMNERVDCSKKLETGFSTILKKPSLDDWLEAC